MNNVRGGAPVNAASGRQRTAAAFENPGAERGHVPGAAPARLRVPIRTLLLVSLCLGVKNDAKDNPSHKDTKTTEEQHSGRTVIMGSHGGLPLHDPLPKIAGLKSTPGRFAATPASGGHDAHKDSDFQRRRRHPWR